MGDTDSTLCINNKQIQNLINADKKEKKKPSLALSSILNPNLANFLRPDNNMSLMDIH